MAICTWPLAVFSVFGAMGDSYPMPDEQEMRLNDLLLAIGLVASLACFAISSWIGGLAYYQSKKRSLAIAILNAAFLLSVLGFFSLDYFGL